MSLKNTAIPMLGCAGMIGLVFGLVVLVVSCFTTNDTQARVSDAIFAAGISFLAALILMIREYVQRTSAYKKVRKRLLSRDDVSDPEFVSRLPKLDPVLLIQVRQSIGKFFDVSQCKIYSDDLIETVYRAKNFEPSFQYFVLGMIFQLRNITPKPFGFSMNNLNSLSDLTNAIQEILDQNKDQDSASDEAAS